MKGKSIKLNVCYQSGNDNDIPEKVTLTFTASDIKQVKHLLAIAKKEDVKISLDFSRDCDDDFDSDVEYLQIYPNGNLCYYTQSSFDSGVQFESDLFKIGRLK